MNIGILYNTFVCLVSGFTSLIVFAFLRKRRKEEKVKYSESLDYFLLLLGLLWVLIAVRIFSTWLNNIGLELFLYKWFIAPLTYVHLLPGFYYFGWSFFRDKRKIHFLFNSFFTCTILLAVITAFKYGFTRPEVTYWGNNIISNPISNKIFTFGVFLPVVPCIIIEIFRRLKKWKRTRDYNERQLFGFSLGFLVYALAGFFEALIFTQGGAMLLARSGIMLASLTFYLSVVWGLEE